MHCECCDQPDTPQGDSGLNLQICCDENSVDFGLTSWGSNVSSIPDAYQQYCNNESMCSDYGNIPNVPSTGVGPGYTGGTSPGYGSDAYVDPGIGGGNVPNQTMVSTGGMGKAKPMSKKKINKKLKEIYNKITKKINKLK